MPKVFASGDFLPGSDLNSNIVQPGTGGTGTRIVSGTTSGSFTATSAVSNTITYGFTFSAAPKVVTTVNIGSNFDVGINFTAAPGTTSVTVRVFQAAGTSITGAYVIHWIAIGPP